MTPNFKLMHGYKTSNDSMPMVTCPKCGTKHDFDYPKCPNCNHKYNI